MGAAHGALARLMSALAIGTYLTRLVAPMLITMGLAMGLAVRFGKRFSAVLFRTLGTITFCTITMGFMFTVLAGLITFGTKAVVTFGTIAGRAATTTKITLGMRQVGFAAIERLVGFLTRGALNDFALALHPHTFITLADWGVIATRGVFIIVRTTWLVIELAFALAASAAITMTVAMTATITTGPFVTTTATTWATAIALRAFATIIITRPTSR